jgi:hypothetical protein
MDGCPLSEVEHDRGAHGAASTLLGKEIRTRPPALEEERRGVRPLFRAGTRCLNVGRLGQEKTNQGTPADVGGGGKGRTGRHRSESRRGAPMPSYARTGKVQRPTLGSRHRCQYRGLMAARSGVTSCGLPRAGEEQCRRRRPTGARRRWLGGRGVALRMNTERLHLPSAARPPAGDSAV